MCSLRPDPHVAWPWSSTWAPCASKAGELRAFACAGLVSPALLVCRAYSWALAPHPWVNTAQFTADPMIVGSTECAATVQAGAVTIQSTSRVASSRPNTPATLHARAQGVSALSFLDGGGVLVSAGEDTQANVWLMADILDASRDPAAQGRPEPLAAWCAHISTLAAKETHTLPLMWLMAYMLSVATMAHIWPEPLPVWRVQRPAAGAACLHVLRWLAVPRLAGIHAHCWPVRACSAMPAQAV